MVRDWIAFRWDGWRDNHGFNMCKSWGLTKLDMKGENMDIKDLFRQALEAEQAIRSINKQREHYMDMATSSTGIVSAIGKSKNREHSQVERAALMLVELSEELEKDALKYAETIRQARKIIEAVPRSRQREVLSLRYLCGMSWRLIQFEMGYEHEKSVCRIHKWALQSAQRVHDDIAGSKQAV